MVCGPPKTALLLSRFRNSREPRKRLEGLVLHGLAAGFVFLLIGREEGGEGLSMKRAMTGWLAGVLCMTGMAVAEPEFDQQLVELGRQVVVQQVEMVAVQDAVREAGPAEVAAVQARLAEQEVRVAAMLQQAKESLAQAAALHAYAQKQMRLAKESLGRSLVLADEAKAMQTAAGRAVQDAAARAQAARLEAEAARQKAAAAVASQQGEEEQSPAGPAVIWGGFRPPQGVPPPADPWAQSRDKGPFRIPQSGTGSDLPSSMPGFPVKR